MKCEFKSFEKEWNKTHGQGMISLIPFRNIPYLKNIPNYVKSFFTTGHESRVLFEVTMKDKVIGWIIKIPDSYPKTNRDDFELFPAYNSQYGKEISALNFVKDFIENGECG